ncbi:hypothetical protein [Nocardia australiensis]|uniref:hypothetical protein n=1 Tax=Nocardia australiensis TaxID=2887191 RepID=UPI001D14ACFE|nr:hypothetical protein [Nocardia australiensis]
MSNVNRRQHELVDDIRASARGLLNHDRTRAIPISTAGRALIRDDQVHGGRNEAAYIEWLQGLRDRGVNTDQTMSDLETLWDYLCHDPKWAFDPERNYGGIIFFGSRDIGGSSVIANLVRDRGIGDAPVPRWREMLGRVTPNSAAL